MLLVVHLLVTGLFVLLGIVFARGKGAGLISGYNTASPEEKAKYDEKKLLRLMSRCMFTLAGCWLVIAAGEALESLSLNFLGLGLFLAMAIGWVIYMNTGNRCRK